MDKILDKTGMKGTGARPARSSPPGMHERFAAYARGANCYCGSSVLLLLLLHQGRLADAVESREPAGCYALGERRYAFRKRCF